jgi:hypothetical protein
MARPLARDIPEALEAGTAAMPSPAQAKGADPTQKLASAAEMEVATGVPASCFAAQARERRIPFRKTRPVCAV